MKIGVFDSGLGGLTIFKEFLRLLPKYDYIYLGDNARVPYGSRSPEIIYQFTKEAVEFLFKNVCKLVILACNTSSANALRKLQREYLTKQFPDRRVLGVIKPVVEEVASLRAKRIGVVGTRATVASHSFAREIRKLLPTAQVFEQACPLLVPIVEEGEGDWSGVPLLLEKYLSPLKKVKIDTLILGCTHYRMLDQQIKHMLGDSVHILSEGRLTAIKLKEYLLRHREIEETLTKKSVRKYFVTDLNMRFEQLAKHFLGTFFTSGKLELIKL